MKCGRQGCPNLIEGRWIAASVYDERIAGRDPNYKEPHIEKWCLACYKNLEGAKYTYVIQKPKGKDNKLKTKRVPRIAKDGEVIADVTKGSDVQSPIDTENLPVWATKAESVVTSDKKKPAGKAFSV